MAGASDKARFYLEQSIPELREWERREIFTRSEIAAVAKKRSGFEHTLNARGSQPSDYARYAEYEMNLDLLLRKRVKRLGIKATAHTGQRKIFFILDRATRKFHGDLGLWMLYIEYARRQKANRKLNRILTDALRLHPTKPDLWIYAAKYAMDVQADTAAARGYMQRGLRFCKASKSMYLEYAKLEMTYIAKIAARRNVLGLNNLADDTAPEIITANSEDADMIALPSMEDNTLEQDQGAEAAFQKLQSSPALNGAIPMLVFDTAMEQFSSDHALGEQFFNMVAEFSQVPCIRRILQHVLDHLLAANTVSVYALSCLCRLPVVGVAVNSASFPAALGQTVRAVKSSLDKTIQRQDLAERILLWFSSLESDDALVPELKKVVSTTVRRLNREVPSPRDSTSRTEQSTQ